MQKAHNDFWDRFRESFNSKDTRVPTEVRSYASFLCDALMLGDKDIGHMDRIGHEAYRLWKEADLRGRFSLGCCGIDLADVHREAINHLKAEGLLHQFGDLYVLDFQGSC